MSLLLSIMLRGYLVTGGLVSPVAPDSVSVADLGVVGDGQTEQSDTLQRILDRYPIVHVPAGRYLINKSLRLRSGQQLSGSDSTVFIPTGEAATAPSFSFFTAEGAQHIRLQTLTFYAEDQPGRTVFAVAAHNVHHLTLNRLVAYHCGVAKVVERAAEWPVYPRIANDLSSNEFRQMGNTHIAIRHCRGEGSRHGMAEHTAGVLIAYTNHWEVSHSSFTRYDQGIQWWGGDSNPERDGALVNVRKCQHGTVSDVQVSYVQGGGIWGSMGENITVENCRVTHCGDVGIDFEGCFRSRALNNYVAESNNGNLAVFHHNRDILFANNQLIQSNTKQIQACIYNASQSRDNGRVTFDNNVFVTTLGVGHIKQQGPSSRIVFTRNSLHNVVVDFSFNNNHRVLVQNNTFHITRPLASFNYVIKAGQTHFGGEVSIENNQILTTVAQNKDVYAINVYQSDYNSSPTNRITDNYVIGMPLQIKTEWSGGNAGRTAKTYIQSKQPLSQDAVKKVDTGARSSTLYVNDKEWKE